MDAAKLHVERTDDGVVFAVKVVPNASRDEIVGLLGTALKVKTTAPPADGKANRALCELIAQQLGVANRNVSVVAGHSRAEKRIAVRNLAVDALRQRLE
jgi:hypothetical protein